MNPAIPKSSKWQWQLVGFGIGVAMFATTELLHWMLDPDPERIRMRMAADALAGLAIAGLGIILAHFAWEQRQASLRRLQTVALLNHEIRNALEVISHSAYVTQNREAIERISAAVNRIDVTLRQVSIPGS
jgi:signal transduction histidine kinase